MEPNTNIDFNRTIGDVEKWLNEIETKVVMVKSALDTLKAWKQAVDEA